MDDSRIIRTTGQAMQRIDLLLSHVWMVRTFLKHCDEAIEDGELCDVHRGLYDYILALGKPWKDQDAAAYLKQAKKKLRRLNVAAELFNEIQEEVSGHTNFQMAARSLNGAVAEIQQIIESVTATDFGS